MKHLKLLNMAAFLITLTFFCSCAMDGEPAHAGWYLDETNTGLRGDHSKLTPIEIDKVGYINAQPLYIAVDNITISDKFIPYPVVVVAKNVVFERCFFQPPDQGAGVPCIISEQTRAIFKDCEMDFSNVPIEKVGIGIVLIGEIYRCNIYGSSSGISIHNPDSYETSVAEGNYVHDLRFHGEAHVDGLTIRNCNGPGGMRITNNHILVESVIATGPLFIEPLQGPINNVLIEDNLLQGYGNTISLGHSSYYRYGDNMQAKNNRLDAWTMGGGGPCYGTTGGSKPGWAVWSENYSYDEENHNDDYKGVLIPTH